TAFRTFIGPPYGPRLQRAVVDLLAALMPGRGGVRRSTLKAGGMAIEIVEPKTPGYHGAVLYLHGGAFVLGSAYTHRSITSHLAHAAETPVWVPNYRLAPEYPYPAAIEDAMACYRLMKSRGLKSEQIVLAGDSAGGALALELAVRLKDLGERPAAVAVISPVTDIALRSHSLDGRERQDPMIRKGWVQQGIAWYGPAAARRGALLDQDLSDLPPMQVQVGDQEILLDDSVRLAEKVAQAGGELRLEVHGGRWHVFHLQTVYLRSARDAVRGIAAFCTRHLARKPQPRPVQAEAGLRRVS
ncbi:MAG: alpha/beta hydrolase, partial [Solimonas sp.]